MVGSAENCFELGNEMSDTSNKGKEAMVTNSEFMAEGDEKDDLKVNYRYKYPEPLANYKDVVEDRMLFLETLGKVHATMATKFMIPTIGGKELDLHRLFVEVTLRGGLDKVVKDKRWREITAAFNFPSTATNASFVLRKYYMLLLGHYEQIYYFGAKGWNSPPTGSSNTPSAASVLSERSADPMLQNSSSVPSVRKRRGNGELASAGPSIPANKSVFGVIDGKIEHGYLVTVTVGTQQLRGVLFHTPEQNPNQASEFSGNHDNSTVGVVRRRRRRKKLSKRDPMHPKPNRSGYNFFFAEQHARLKPLHPGKDREISKMIGDLWNRITETEKAVYQERGVKDKERYKSEMAVYKERITASQVISNAVPIRQCPADTLDAMVGVDSKLNIDENEGDSAEGDENESCSNDSSDTEGKKLEDDEELELETSPDMDIGGGTESTSLANEGDDGFELRRRDDVQEHPSLSEDADSKKFSEPSIDHK